MPNLIPNGAFTSGQMGQIPDGWHFIAPVEARAPVMKLATVDGAQAHVIEGNGESDCLGWLSTSFVLEGGKTYQLSVRFSASVEIDPHTNLLFAFITPGFNNGIFEFFRGDDAQVLGRSRFVVPGDGMVTGEVRLLFRYSATGTVSIWEVCMEECEAAPSRTVKVACTNGLTDMAGWAKVLDAAGAEAVDLVLLPEDIAGPSEVETLDGPSPTLMSVKAAEHRIYVAGGFLLREEDGRLHNVGALFGRTGELVGLYRKNHLYITEQFAGVTPGRDVPVFATDFGKVGFVICYDSFFSDVFELLALKGAELILFPNAGYYRSLMPARAADNGVRIVASSWADGYGVWDTSGQDATSQHADESRRCAQSGLVSVVKSASVHGARVFDCDMAGLRPTDREVVMLIASVDLGISAAPHHRTGPMSSGPGGHRNRRGQQRLLLDELAHEYARWWEE